MKEGSKEKKSILFYIGIGLIGILTLLGVGLWLHCYWKGKVDDEDGYNSIDSSIAFIALLVNLVTVILVYYTFKLQSDEIKRNRNDVEFNRVLDIIYKQLEYTINRYNYVNKLQSTYKLYLKKISYFLTTENFIDLIHPNGKNIYYLVEVFETFIIKEFEVYYRVINSNNQLSSDDKVFFTNLYLNNIDTNIIDNIVLFQELYFDFQQSGQYSDLKKDDPSSTFDFIELKLKLVLQYLNIPIKEGLKLN